MGMADVVEDARIFIDGADYEAAMEIIKTAIENNPKSSQLGMLNQLLGECLFETGDYSGARPHFEVARTKGVADAYRFLGRLAFLDYDFSAATDNYAKYKQLKIKAKKPIAIETDEELSRITKAKEFLERVEKVAIIDSIATDFSDFYNAYRLPTSAGRITAPSKIPFEESSKLASMAFLNEAGDFAMWAEPDTLGVQRIYESWRLTDDSWHSPTLSGVNLLEGNSDYPFMQSDGLTLYFANEGPESIGGYDIFVASRDAATGEYFQPRNMGMPYNSPYDDFMLAIDEENGIGWWATDRNRLDGKVTIYVFIPNELRTNYNPEEDDVLAYARLTRIADTQGNTDFSDKLAMIAEITPEKESKEMDFRLPMGKGVVYTSVEDFKTPSGREAMEIYQEALRNFESDKTALRELRKTYASSPSKSLAEKIRQAEKALETDRGRLHRLKSDVYKSEKQGL